MSRNRARRGVHLTGVAAVKGGFYGSEVVSSQLLHPSNSLHMFSLSNRALLRWNGWGLLIGTAFASIATLPLVLLTDHPGGTLVEFLWKIPALWLAIFVAVSPLLLTVLIFWRAVARRQPSLERRALFRWFGLLCLAWLCAAATHVALAIYAATSEPTFEWTYVWYRVVTDSAFFGLLLIAAVGWLVMPRLRVAMIL